MYFLTKEKDDISSGTWATIDVDGIPCIQFFKNKDDAEFYQTQLEALDAYLQISELPDEHVDMMCDTIGLAYSVVEPGEIVYPKLETFQVAFGKMLGH